MSDTYTPTTEEVRDAYANFFEGHRAISRRRAFKRWLAAHDAQVRAETLREAARWYWNNADETMRQTIPQGNNYVSVPQWLMDKAEEIDPASPVHDEGEKR
ncbi:hypothetical protein SK224_08185 [Microbacterium sp. BG28]|uniref:hypothetical protein n=1 Tax=Microbacterium sp. BG28 TaxID=3097356 RepID=UPI002A59A1BD|nr:hypothetical protein [Microbacterium sp. BG28]MDY0829106.1 hypothetical protein [Microbacterium sp. BG28]